MRLDYAGTQAPSLLRFAQQQISIARIGASYSDPSHFGTDNCTDGPDEAESLVRLHVVGLTLYSLLEESMTQRFQHHRLCRACISLPQSSISFTSSFRRLYNHGVCNRKEPAKLSSIDYIYSIYLYTIIIHSTESTFNGSAIMGVSLSTARYIAPISFAVSDSFTPKTLSVSCL